MESLFISAESLQNLLVAHATGSVEDESEYLALRKSLLADKSVRPHVPNFIHTCRSLGQFWQFIKGKFSTYAERRKYLWDQFRPLLEKLENGSASPSDLLVSGSIEVFDSEHIRSIWSKALERRTDDPEGAITAARTLLESVCKHILDELHVVYDDSSDLNKLYRQTAEGLRIAPSQHTEQVFRQILGGCTAVIEGLGSLRNRLSDSHGRGKSAVKPAARHAELAVNLAGTLAMFLLATLTARLENH